MYQLIVSRPIRIGEKACRPKLVIDMIIRDNPFNEHDTAGILFAIEFAANNHSELPIRLHINEIYETTT